MKISTEFVSDLVGSDHGASLRISVLETLFDEDPEVAFFIKDHQGRYLSVNRSLAERHGFTRKEDMIGKRPAEVCPGPFGEVPTEQDARVIRTGRPIVNHMEMQWLRPHRPCWCLTTKIPLRKDTDIIGIVGFSRDLKEGIPVADIPTGLALALEELESNCGEAHSPSSLAKRAVLSPQQFARLMKRLFGVTPSQYISKTRIKKAAALLRDSAVSISEIALDCGFSDHSAFTRAFRSIMGLTPSRYREEMGKSPARKKRCESRQT